jgi:hypothetical protein
VSGVETEHAVRGPASTPEKARMEGRVPRCAGSLDARRMRTQVLRFSQPVLGELRGEWERAGGEEAQGLRAPGQVRGEPS